MILFVAATEKELENLIRGSLPADLLQNQGREEKYRGKKIGVLACGVGPLNAAISLERFFTLRQKVSAVVNIGIAGSYNLRKLPLGSVCLAHREIWPEYGLRDDYCLAQPEKLGFPLDARGPEIIWNSLQLHPGAVAEKAGLSLDPGWHQGISITMAGVSSRPEHVQRIVKIFQADTENMEGFALAYCCYLRSVPFLEVRTISNLAGTRDRNKWDLKSALGGLRKVWQGLWRSPG